MGPEHLAAFPEAIEGCDDGAGNDVIENLQKQGQKHYTELLLYIHTAAAAASSKKGH